MNKHFQRVEGPLQGQLHRYVSTNFAGYNSPKHCNNRSTISFYYRDDGLDESCTMWVVDFNCLRSGNGYFIWRNLKDGAIFSVCGCNVVM